MHRFGKSSIWTAAGFAFVSGLLLLPTQSSAQYINIEGMIRGALQGGGFQPYNGGGGGGGYVRQRSNSGYSSRHAKSQPKEQESAPVDKSKERDATQLESANNNVPSGRQSLAAPAPAPAPAAPPPTSPARSGGDEPAFSPSR
jgi:hypothetical protein